MHCQKRLMYLRMYSSTISYLYEVTCNNPQHAKSPTLIILKQKISTNTKSPMLLTQLVL